MVRFPYHSHIFRDSDGSGMGIVWEAYHKGFPLLVALKIPLNLKQEPVGTRDLHPQLEKENIFQTFYTPVVNMLAPEKCWERKPIRLSYWVLKVTFQRAFAVVKLPGPVISHLFFMLVLDITKRMFPRTSQDSSGKLLVGFTSCQER